ncbi:MAG: TIGR03503 family protein [Shewanella sp.]|nr:TIGR03503 family protein [Shewanella sp.]MCF1431640.1 TIGR03503 family protein [Shewanella sp.]MCF1456337.1 TIGR03503 family protein [Shewanella sp.]
MKLLQRLALAGWLALTGSAIPAATEVAAANATKQADGYTPFNAQELKNLFRIDHMVDKVTLLVSRPYGSASVVVVTPDGEKWYASRHPENVRWFDGITGDFITVEKPQPGPYQLLGTLSPGSTIELVSALSLELEPLPQPLYQGERVNVTARFLGDEKLIRMPGLEYMIEWRARLTSLQNADEQNYIAGTFPIGSYADNGEIFDEVPDDGIFTADLNLKQDWGSYTFSVIAENKVFERQINIPIYLSETPIRLEVIKPQDASVTPWKLRVTVDDAQVMPSQTVVNLKQMGPSSEPVPMLLDQLIGGENDIDLSVGDYGRYRITGNIASTTVGGREILLSMDDLFFNNLAPPVPPADPRLRVEQAAKETALADAARQKQLITWVIIGNLVLMLIGGAAIIIWRKQQTLKADMAAAQQQTAVEKGKGPESQRNDADNLDDLDLALSDTQAGSSFEI